MNQRFKCPCCEKNFSTAGFLMNHAYRYSQFDESHRLYFFSFFKKFDDLFYDINYHKYVDIHDAPDFVCFDSIKIYWNHVFGKENVKKRNNMIKRFYSNEDIQLCELMKLKKIETNNIFDLSQLENHKCPVCYKSFGRSLYGHCKKFYSSHNFFIKQQIELIHDIKNDFGIKTSKELEEKGFLFGINCYKKFLPKLFGKEFTETKRKYNEKITKQSNKGNLKEKNEYKKGKKNSFRLDDIKNKLIIPKHINFNHIDKTYKQYDIHVCEFCGNEIKTTLWNHCVLNRDDKKHLDFLVEQCNNILDAFYNLNVKILKISLEENHIYAGVDKLQQLWKEFFSKEDLRKRMILLRKEKMDSMIHH